MNIDNEELKKDLEEQYAMLEEEVQEDKKKKRYLVVLVFFLILFLVVFGTTFSYFKIYDKNDTVNYNKCLIKTLYIENYEEEFKFDCDIEKYALSITTKEKLLNFKYELMSSKAKIEIIGNDDLQVGVNEIKIILKDENDNEKVYVIYVTVEEDDNIEQDPEENKKPGSSNNPGENNNVGENNNLENENSNSDLHLKNLNVSNHKMNYPFAKEHYSYIVDDIKINENKIMVNFELMDNSNSVELKLNDTKVSRIPTFNNNIYSIYFDVQRELIIGANKLEITVKDNNGNEKKYYLFLVVNDEIEEQKIVELVVEYGNNDGKYNFSSIIPGWESSEKQHIKITNTSNYDVNIDLFWSNVSNNFVNTSDLEYTLYKENKVLKTEILPIKDENIITNLKVEANSVNNYYISYRYLYKDIDQNVDQGKSFSTEIKVFLSK